MRGEEIGEAVLITCILISIFIAFANLHNISKQLWSIVLFFGYLLCIDAFQLLNGKNIFNWYIIIGTISTYISIGILLDIDLKRNNLTIVRLLFVAYSILLTIAYISEWQNIMYSFISGHRYTNAYWLVAYRNSIPLHIFFWELYGGILICHSKKGTLLKLAVFVAIGFLLVYLVKSAGGLVAYLGLIGTLVICFIKKRGISVKVFFMGYLIIVVAFAFFAKWVIDRYFADFITGVLKRSTDLTYRVVLWAEYLNEWKASPIFGNGTLDLYFSQFLRHFYAHSLLIEILFMSGLVGLFLYARPFIALIKPLNMIRGNRVHAFILACLAAFLVEGIQGSLAWGAAFFPVLITAYHIPRLFIATDTQTQVEQFFCRAKRAKLGLLLQFREGDR
jgi:O-antigen ligase